MRDESGFEARGVGYLLLAFAMCCLPAAVFAQAQPSALPGYADVAASAQPDDPGSSADSSATAESDPATLAQAAAPAQSTSAPAADKQPSPPAAQAPTPTPAAAAEAKPPDEIVPIKNVHHRWGTYDLAGHPEYTFNPFDPYHQNTLKADYPIGTSEQPGLQVAQQSGFSQRASRDDLPLAQ
jgi:hypothetical protein